MLSRLIKVFRWLVSQVEEGRLEPYHLEALIMGVALGVILLVAMIVGLYISERSARRSPGEPGSPE